MSSLVRIFVKNKKSWGIGAPVVPWWTVAAFGSLVDGGRWTPACRPAGWTVDGRQIMKRE
ncbi:MAG: hypothetical protein AAGG75_19205 [Bacteroidota bacterium]